MNLKKIAEWVDKYNLPFIVTCFGMCVILLWVGSFKFYAEEANGVAPLVQNSPLAGWDYAVFGIRNGASFIGLFEIIAATCILIGLYKPKVGMVGSLLTIGIFLVTTTFLFSTPGTLKKVEGIWRLSDLGLFLFKDIILLGASLYLFSHFGKKVTSAAYKDELSKIIKTKMN